MEVKIICNAEWMRTWKFLTPHHWSFNLQTHTRYENASTFNISIAVCQFPRNGQKPCFFTFLVYFKCCFSHGPTHKNGKRLKQKLSSLLDITNGLLAKVCGNKNSLLLYIWVTSHMWLSNLGTAHTDSNHNLNWKPTTQRNSDYQFQKQIPTTPVKPLFKETKIMTINEIKSENCLLTLNVCH